MCGLDLVYLLLLRCSFFTVRVTDYQSFGVGKVTFLFPLVFLSFFFLTKHETIQILNLVNISPRHISPFLHLTTITTFPTCFVCATRKWNKRKSQRKSRKIVGWYVKEIEKPLFPKFPWKIYFLSSARSKRYKGHFSYYFHCCLFHFHLDIHISHVPFIFHMCFHSKNKIVSFQVFIFPHMCMPVLQVLCTDESNNLARKRKSFHWTHIRTVKSVRRAATEKKLGMMVVAAVVV